jgi:hypothetical protein
MKRILQTLIFFFSFVITTNGFALETLAKGQQKGKIKFESVPVITLNQFLKGETNKKSVKISGKLKFPKKFGNIFPASGDQKHTFLGYSRTSGKIKKWGSAALAKPLNYLTIVISYYYCNLISL